MLTLHPPAREADIARKLQAMRRAYEAASNADDRTHNLLGALTLCGSFRPLPHWLFEALHKLLAARLPQEPNMHWARWLLVREGKRRREGHSQTPSWEDAYEYASERLAETPWSGTPRTMKASYQIVQRDIRRRRR